MQATDAELFQGASATVLSRKRSRLSHEDYKIACFAPLSEELAPLRAMLDSEHDVLPIEPNRNAYVLGQFGPHNVVLVQLCGTGTHETSAAAMQLKRDFPSIQFGLLAGVAGGIPNGSGEQDIRLGDVVVGLPDGNSGGVIQFDRGKRHGASDFQVISHLNKPPPFLNATAKTLKAQHDSGRSQIPKFISDMLKRHPDMRIRYSHPGLHNDILYRSEYEHVGGMTCETCDTDGVLYRNTRQDTHPKIHYGTIGSSNGVLRSAIERDRLGRDHCMFCVEMEAAGLADTLPCLVIRGICDYADSHKNKTWQPYAAAAAAAYVKELLIAIPPIGISISDTENPSLVTVRPGNDAAITPVESRLSLFLDSLRFDGMDQRLRDVAQALPHTCDWLFDHAEYRDWISRDNVQDHHGFLWVKGKPGSGKSTIMKAALHHLRTHRSRDLVVSYFFHARSANEMEKSVLGLLQSLVYRLLDLYPNGRNRFLEYFDLKERHGVVSPWTIAELQGYLTFFVRNQKDRSLNIFIDALDEGDDEEVAKMIAFFEDLASHAFHSDSSLRICLSSRHYPHISIQRGVSLVIEKEPGHDRDITTYVREKLARGSRTDDDEIEVLRSRIREKSEGIFLWVVLVVKLLNDVYTRGNSVQAMFQSLEGIPKELDGLFSSILARDRIDISECVALLQWVLYARRSLSPAELFVAVKLNSSAKDVNNPSMDAERLDRYILNRSRGLTETIDSTPPVVQFIHETVREFLEDKGLAQIDSKLLGCVVGSSHDLIKTNCQAYLDSNVLNSAYASSNGTLSKDEQQVIRIQYPLLDYAVHHIFWHADVAEANKISQLRFLQQYMAPYTVTPSHRLRAWARLRNLFQLYNVRKYTENIYLLYVVAEQGLEHLLQALIRSRVDVNHKGERFGSALQAACAAGFEQMVDRLLHAGASVNQEGGEFGHSLCTAIQYKRESLMRLLCTKPISLESKILQARLFTSVAKGYTQGVEALLNIGLSVNSVGSRGGVTPLIHALHKKNAEMVKLLILRGANVDYRLSNGQTALMIASAQPYEQGVQILLDSKVDINLVNSSSGETALYSAICGGHEQIIKALLDNGADVNIKSSPNGQSALITASRTGHERIVKMLLDNGADVNEKSGYSNQNALCVASSYGHERIVKMLLDNGADANEKSGSSDETALFVASSYGHERIVKMLLDNGANVNEKSGYSNQNALCVASGNGHEQIVKLLLDNGADVDIRCYFHNETALIRASRNGYKQIVKILLDNGADINIQCGHSSVLASLIVSINDYEQVIKTLWDNSYGENALVMASYGDHRQIAEMLLDKGADMNMRCGPGGVTALLVAVYQGHEQIVKILINAGVELSFQYGPDNQTVLSIAIRKNYPRIVEMLLEKGVDANSTEVCGSPLYDASFCGFPQIVEMLLSKGADVNNGGLSTPLVAASRCGHEQVVKILLEHGADMNHHCSTHGTALEAARSAGHDNIVQILMQHDEDLRNAARQASPLARTTHEPLDPLSDTPEVFWDTSEY